ncbi:MAG: hypothetical protein ABIH20_06275 [Candidatus Diapherotrites archaeon]
MPKFRIPRIIPRSVSKHIPYFGKPKTVPQVVREQLASGISPAVHKRAVWTGFKKIHWTKEESSFIARYLKKKGKLKTHKIWATYDNEGNLK